MKRRAAAAALVALLAVAGAACSNDVNVARRDGKMCEQTTKSKLFGWTYSTDRSLRNCGPGEGDG